MSSFHEPVEFVRRPEGAAESAGQIARGVIPPAVKVKRQAKGSLAFSSMMSGHDENARDPEHRRPESVVHHVKGDANDIRRGPSGCFRKLADVAE